jgi:hypothetical protein
MDDLRLLVTQYAGLVLESLVSSAEFRPLLEEFGQLSRDLVLQVAQRLK